MKLKFLAAAFLMLLVNTVNAQNIPLEKFSELIGKWSGTGSVSETSESVIHSEFNWVMNKKYIEVKNHSEFKLTAQNPQGEIHDDVGFISFDRSRKRFVFRQFHVEGFVNQYVLNDSLSVGNKFVFESEIIENFVPGGRARYTLILKSGKQLETWFDLAMPGKEMTCYGQNQLTRE